MYIFLLTKKKNTKTDTKKERVLERKTIFFSYKYKQTNKKLIIIYFLIFIIIYFFKKKLKKINTLKWAFLF